jgi:hypothetical protein
MVSCIYVYPKAISILFCISSKPKIYSVSCLPSQLGTKIQTETPLGHSAFDHYLMNGDPFLFSNGYHVVSNQHSSQF